LEETFQQGCAFGDKLPPVGAVDNPLVLIKDGKDTGLDSLPFYNVIR
jgi:hypothetical protein